MISGDEGAKMVAVCGGDDRERHAAEELVRYVGEVSGQSVPVVAEPAPEGSAILSVGASEVAAGLLAQGVLEVPDEMQGEGFLVRSISESGTEHLIFWSPSPLGCLYAVYRYLEVACGAGFFWDGEQIPRLAELPVKGIDIVETPRFPVRQYMMDCEYTSYWWGGREWRSEADWAAKHRFNLLSSNFDFTATWRRVWQDLGVQVAPQSLSGPPYHPWAGWHKWDIFPPYPEELQDTVDSLCRDFVSYGRSIGLKMAPDYRGFLGQVPREVYEAF